MAYCAGRRESRHINRPGPARPGPARPELGEQLHIRILSLVPSRPRGQALLLHDGADQRGMVGAHKLHRSYIIISCITASRRCAPPPRWCRPARGNNEEGRKRSGERLHIRVGSRALLLCAILVIQCRGSRLHTRAMSPVSASRLHSSM